MPFSDVAAEILTKASARLTAPRRSVLRCFDKASRPLSTARIIQKVCRADSHRARIDPVSVYRTLDLLSRLRLIHRVGPSGEYLPCNHVKCGKKHHALILCNRCESVEEVSLPDSMVQPLYWYLAEQFRFEPDPHVVRVSGICRNCQRS